MSRNMFREDLLWAVQRQQQRGLGVAPTGRAYKTTGFGGGVYSIPASHTDCTWQKKYGPAEGKSAEEYARTSHVGKSQGLTPAEVTSFFGNWNGYVSNSAGRLGLFLGAIPPGGPYVPYTCEQTKTAAASATELFNAGFTLFTPSGFRQIAPYIWPKIGTQGPGTGALTYEQVMQKQTKHEAEIAANTVFNIGGVYGSVTPTQAREICVNEGGKNHPSCSWAYGTKPNGQQSGGSGSQPGGSQPGGGSSGGQSSSGTTCPSDKFSSPPPRKLGYKISQDSNNCYFYESACGNGWLPPDLWKQQVGTCPEKAEQPYVDPNTGCVICGRKRGCVPQGETPNFACEPPYEMQMVGNYDCCQVSPRLAAEARADYEEKYKKWMEERQAAMTKAREEAERRMAERRAAGEQARTDAAARQSTRPSGFPLVPPPAPSPSPLAPSPPAGPPSRDVTSAAMAEEEGGVPWTLILLGLGALVGGGFWVKSKFGDKAKKGPPKGKGKGKGKPKAEPKAEPEAKPEAEKPEPEAKPEEE